MTEQAEKIAVLFRKLHQIDNQLTGIVKALSLLSDNVKSLSGSQESTMVTVSSMSEAVMQHANAINALNMIVRGKEH